MECLDIYIYMKAECLQSKFEVALFGWDRVVKDAKKINQSKSKNVI